MRLERTYEWGLFPLPPPAGKVPENPNFIHIRDCTCGGTKICTIKISGMEQRAIFKKPMTFKS
jgi:hypothetical protein